MKILAIESTCDETSASVVKDGREVLSNEIVSQIDIHTKFGGVVPEIASRNHLLKISEVVDRALDNASLLLDDIDKIAVSKGPGLVGALLVGINYAKALSYATGKKLIAVNHLAGHICSPFLTYKELQPPFLCLIVSGGHSYIIEYKKGNKLNILGKTRDDALGEAYDKVARTIGFDYPGGAKIDRAAKLGDSSSIDFPRVFLEKDSFDFSFSGIKSSVMNYVNSKRQKNEEINPNDISASFQEAVLEVVEKKTFDAASKYSHNKIVVVGGVSANSRLREIFIKRGEKEQKEIYFPELKYCTDNAAMIASAAYYLPSKTENYLSLNAYPSLGLDLN